MGRFGALTFETINSSIDFNESRVDVSIVKPCKVKQTALVSYLRRRSIRLKKKILILMYLEKMCHTHDSILPF